MVSICLPNTGRSPESQDALSILDSCLNSFFGVSDLPLGLKPSLWPGYHGPFLRKHEFAEVGERADHCRLS